MPKATGVYKASNGTWYFKLFHSLDDAGRRRFERKRKIMGQLSDHPNAITLFRAG